VAGGGRFGSVIPRRIARGKALVVFLVGLAPAVRRITHCGGARIPHLRALPFGESRRRSALLCCARTGAPRNSWGFLLHAIIAARRRRERVRSIVPGGSLAGKLSSLCWSSIVQGCWGVSAHRFGARIAYGDMSSPLTPWPARKRLGLHALRSERSATGDNRRNRRRPMLRISTDPSSASFAVGFSNAWRQGKVRQSSPTRSTCAPKSASFSSSRS